MSAVTVNDRRTTMCVDETTIDVDIEQDQETTIVRVRRDECWQFRVECRSARLVEPPAAEQCPDWVERLLLNIGIEEVVVE
jgi:hypothetical protein